MKKALVVAATAGFMKGFLLHDMTLLQQMGYEVHCAANANAVKTFNVEELFSSQGVQFHQIDFSSTSPLSKESMIAAKQFKQLIKEQQFEVIHCHTPIVGAVVRLTARKLRKKGCKIIYTSHGLAFPKGSGLKSKLIYGGTEWICSWFSDAIITINYEDYNTMRKMGCKEVFHINGVGVDTNRYHDVKINRFEYRREIGVQDDDIMVLSVGELSQRKNQQIIIKALATLKDSRYVFVICGKAMAENGIYNKLVNMAEELNVRVIFLGFRTDIPEISNCADIAVLPSLREGLGLAGVEALASGVPVIGAAVQGIKDYVVDDKTGYLCSATDEVQIAEKILKLSDSELRDRMKPYCIEKAEEFSIEVSYRQMEEIYNKVLS